MILTPSVDADASSASLRVTGELDQTSADGLIAAASDLLAAHPGLRHLHLDFGGLEFCNSAGLSALLEVHRSTSAAGVHLHLDHRPAHLDRVLDITGVLDHLTSLPPTGTADESELG